MEGLIYILEFELKQLMKRVAYSFWELLQRNVLGNTSPCWLWTWCMCALVTATGQRVSWWALWKALRLSLSLSFRKKDSCGWEKQNYIECISTALERFCALFPANFSSSSREEMWESWASPSSRCPSQMPSRGDTKDGHVTSVTSEEI